MDFLPAALRPSVVRSIDGGGVLLLLSLSIIGSAFLLVRENGALAGPEKPGLSETLDSPEAVARAVLHGLDQGDRRALENLAVTADEFRDLVWPKLPASRPERNLPLDYVWKDLAAKSAANLGARLSGSKSGLTLISLEFAGGVQDYGTFRVHRDTVLSLKDRDGRELRARLFGSAIESEGRFKVFSYVVD